MDLDLQVFLYAVDEYRRFAEYLPINKNIIQNEQYLETDYIGVNVRLMLLRKFFVTNGSETVSYKNIVAKGINNYPSFKARFEEIEKDFKNAEQQMVHVVLNDGNILNLFEFTRNCMYGLHLHADKNKLKNLFKTDERVRVYCICRYVYEIEPHVYKLYDLLIECGVDKLETEEHTKSSLIYLDDPTKNKQLVTKDVYWSNMYGKDITDEGLKQIVDGLTSEEKEILIICMTFISELENEIVNIKLIKKIVHPFTRTDWGDFSEVKDICNRIPNIGISSKVRFNENKDTAHVRIFPNVESGFIVDTPHVISGVQEISLGKWFGKWKIYSFGGHLDSIYQE